MVPAREKEHMPEHESLDDAISVIAERASTMSLQVTRTKLVKLLYFVDLRAWELYGRTVTGVEWIWHNYGPFSSEILSACRRLQLSDELDIEVGRNYYGSPQYEIQSSSPAYYRIPSNELVALIDEVLNEFGALRASVIGDRSYDTGPMKRVIATGHRGDQIEFDNEDRHQQPRNRRPAKKYQRIARETAGDDLGDIAHGLLSESDALAEGRRSAGSQLLADV
jgi:hypothetical protein